MLTTRDQGFLQYYALLSNFVDGAMIIYSFSSKKTWFIYKLWIIKLFAYDSFNNVAVKGQETILCFMKVVSFCTCIGYVLPALYVYFKAYYLEQY